ncbi:MAG: AAA family ATPase [Clostridia bacterium]|nr:AAA family ATPase [Clostridia bacterium]MDD4387023.1 AAA family ATPase [Clostridia bacterium]
MKLISFSVTNYRSITNAHKINLNDATVLLGKNNEGKSNIIKALALSMSVISGRYRRTMYKGKNETDNYDWERDFPVDLQNRKNGLNTIFKLDFELDENEVRDFRREVKSRVHSGEITIQIQIGKNNIPDITIPKKGTANFTKKKIEINNFIRKRIQFNYISAIRTEEDAINIVEETLSQELRIIEKQDEYLAAIEKINNLQNDILNNIGGKIKEVLVKFLPNITDVKLKIEEEQRRFNLRRNIDVIINDGTPTKIEYKGDGIKSLVSLAMLTDRYNIEGASIIAIDEPEAHLHPEVIRELNKVIIELSRKNQVIVSTHNPLFVNKMNLRSNIIINDGKAKIVKNIKEIRDILGVRVTDNLINADKVLIVEGQTDKIVLEKIFCCMSAKIKKSMDDKSFEIIALSGASKLSERLYQMSNYMCKYLVLLDNDDEGHKSFDLAKKGNLLEIKNTIFTNCIGMAKSEFEDCFLSEAYRVEIKEEYGVDIDNRNFKTNKKWSERMESTFLNQAKSWNEQIEKEVKIFVANVLIAKMDSENILNANKRNSIDYLIKSIEEILNYESNI